MTEVDEMYPEFRPSEIDELGGEKYGGGGRPSWPVDGPITQSRDAPWPDGEYATRDEAR